MKPVHFNITHIEITSTQTFRTKFRFMYLNRNNEVITLTKTLGLSLDSLDKSKLIEAIVHTISLKEKINKLKCTVHIPDSVYDNMINDDDYIKHLYGSLQYITRDNHVKGQFLDFIDIDTISMIKHDIEENTKIYQVLIEQTKFNEITVIIYYEFKNNKYELNKTINDISLFIKEFSYSFMKRHYRNKVKEYLNQRCIPDTILYDIKRLSKDQSFENMAIKQLNGKISDTMMTQLIRYHKINKINE